MAAQSQRNGRIGYAYGKLLQISYCTSERGALSSSEEEEEEDDEEVEEEEEERDAQTASAAAACMQRRRAAENKTHSPCILRR